MQALDAELDPTAAHRQGMELMSQKRWDEGLELLQGVIDGRFGRPDADMLKSSYRRVMRTLADLSRWPELEAAAGAARARFPEDADAHRRLGEALYFQGRREDARTALETAVTIDPDFAEARSALSLLRGQEDPPATQRVVRPWPGRRKHFEEPRRLIGKYLLRGRPRDRFITPDSAFFTLGSCFAGNLASRLTAKGFTVHYEDIGEEVNSTFANRSLLDWIEQGVVDEPTRVMDELYGPRVRARFRKGLKHCQVFVMTLGVAACFFREDTGDFAFAPLNTRLGADTLFSRYRMRTTTVVENVENIAAIIAAVRRLAKRPPRIVLTVSPVPLAGTTEHSSAIIADTLSKATLRLACEEAVNAHADQGVLYWPSFEMVRWLGAHYGPEHPAYAGDDDDTRHVSGWLVDTIVDMFLEEHARR